MRGKYVHLSLHRRSIKTGYRGYHSAEIFVTA